MFKSRTSVMGNEPFNSWVCRCLLNGVRLLRERGWRLRQPVPREKTPYRLDVIRLLETGTSGLDVIAYKANAVAYLGNLGCHSEMWCYGWCLR